MSTVESINHREAELTGNKIQDNIFSGINGYNYEIKRVHFIGIGGISMSGLAEILKSRGYEVTGSDMKDSAILGKLRDAGIETVTGHAPGHVDGADIVVYTAAVKKENPELSRALELGITCIDRAALLGKIMDSYNSSIAISGTHGKTTTTSMISMVLLECGKDPTIHIGGELEAIKGTTRIGSNQYFVAEACEYYESFLKFNPSIGVVLNIEYDHADYFKDIDHVTDTFRKFTGKIPPDGHLVACMDDGNVRKLTEGLTCKLVTYGLDSSGFDWSAENIRYSEMACARYTLLHKGIPMGEIELSVPGIHNVRNSLAAIAACSLLSCDMECIKSAFIKFHGTLRRFEKKGERKEVRVIDDYAHHPSEVMATLDAAVNAPHRLMWCVFQPHTYTRTKHLMEDFSRSFKNADRVIVTDIYAARETDPGDVHSTMLVDRINSAGTASDGALKALYAESLEAAVSYLEQNTAPGDLILTMGAGDIYKAGEIFLSLP